MSRHGNSPFIDGNMPKANTWSEFDSVAMTYQFRPNYADGVALFLSDFLSRRPNKIRVADIGAGTGTFTRQIANTVGRGEIIGVEPNDPMRKTAEGWRSAIPVTYVKGSGESVPLASGIFSAVTAAAAAHRFVLDTFLAEAARLLGDGGILMIIDKHPAEAAPQFHDQYLAFQERHLPAYLRGMNSDGRGGYFKFDPRQELQRHPDFAQVAKRSWAHEDRIDRSQFEAMARSSSVVNRIMSERGQYTVLSALLHLFDRHACVRGEVSLKFNTICYSAVRCQPQMRSNLTFYTGCASGVARTSRD